MRAAELPREGIARAAQFVEAIGTLTLVGDESVAETASAYDDAVVGPEVVAQRLLFLGDNHEVFDSAIEVAGGLDVAHTLLDVGLDLTEASGVADDTREVAGQGVERHVEGETTGILAIQGLITASGKESEE